MTYLFNDHSDLRPDLIFKPCTHGRDSRQEKNIVFPDEIPGKIFLPAECTHVPFKRTVVPLARMRGHHRLRRACARHIQCRCCHLTSPYLCLGSYRACVKVISSMCGFQWRQVCIHTLGFLGRKTLPRLSRRENREQVLYLSRRDSGQIS